MSKVRIITTFNCNRSCRYCCNKYPAVRKSFKPITIPDLLLTEYEEYMITGGEPLIEPGRLFSFCKLLRDTHPDAKIWLYTNGDLLAENLIDRFAWEDVFDGVNIGVHGIPNFRLLRFAYNLSRRLSVRFLVPDDMRHPDSAGYAFVQLARELKLKIRFWKINDCMYMPDEPRFYLKSED